MKQTIINLLKSPSLTVEKVQRAGFRVYIQHHRYALDFDNDNYEATVLVPLHKIPKDLRIGGTIRAKGGKTEVEIVDKASNFSMLASANCSVQDAYVKNDVIRLALTRALRYMLVEIRRKENIVHSE